MLILDLLIVTSRGGSVVRVWVNVTLLCGVLPG